MSVSRQPLHKITISVPADLLAFADEQAQRLKTSRSQYLSQALAQLRVAELERLAAEGYGFYAYEATAFAEASAEAATEAFSHER